MNEPVVCPACFEPEPVTGGYFVSAYPPFDYWSADQLDAYRDALGRTDSADEPLGLYVHIPFCEQRCDYCYYLSYEARSVPEIDEYLAALRKELALYGSQPAFRDRPFDFVYFGGGTPSLLSRDRLARLLDGLGETMSSARPRETTFECAPRSVTRAKLELLRDFGVTRISMGVQQLDDRVLRLNGRPHLVADIERAFDDIRQVGFDVVNLDLIVGLVGESDETFFSSLERVLEMAPDCVTVYQLEIPHNTPLFRDLGSDAVAGDLPDWPLKRQRLESAYERLAEDGYVQRSAYTAVRDTDRHGFIYQDAQYHGADLLGIGASSFSYLNGVHHQNAASLGDYLDAIDPDRLPLGRAYALSTEERFVREWALQIKLGSLDRDSFRAKFSIDPWQRFAPELRELVDHGWLEMDDTTATLTRAGLPRADRILTSFYLPAHRRASA